jgi:hypothetical protein
VADSSALRKRRHRAHKKGDHSLCVPGRCPDAPAAADVEAAVGEIERRLAKALGHLELAEGDPRQVVSVMALQLARSLDGRVTASVARELRGCVEVLWGREPDEAERRAAEQTRKLLSGLTGLAR